MYVYMLFMFISIELTEKFNVYIQNIMNTQKYIIIV